MARFVAFLLVLVAGGLVVATPGHAAEFLWPTAFMNGEVPALYAEDVLGPPDLRLADFRAGGTSVTYSAFAQSAAFAPAALAALLGVPAETLAAADVVAFEAWGLSFEASVWTFRGGGADHTLAAPDDGVAHGTLALSAYAEFFGIPGDMGRDVMQWVLLDTGPVDALAADFTVEVARGWGPFGSPDLDAIGVLVGQTVPDRTHSWSGIHALYR